MATVVTYNGISYSVPAVNEEDWQSLSNYLIALATASPSGGSVSSNVRISTSATTAVAVTDYAVLINYAGPATVNLPAGVDKQIFVIADVSNAAATNNITINRNGANTILGGTSLVLDRNNEVVILAFSGGNWYRIGQALPNSLSSPNSTVANGLVAYAGTDGKQAIDLGVGSANQILKTDGTTPAFGLIINDNVDASAAIAYSKLNLAGSIVNADINSSAAIEYSKLNLTGKIVNTDINATAAIAYSKLNLANSIQNTDVAAAANIAYSKLDLTGAIVNADISASAAVAYSKLDLADSIVNADINSAAAIAYSKLNLSGSIVDADINASAAIARTKIASGSASHVVVNDGAGVLSSVAVLPVSQGGTGLSALGSALQVLRVDSLGTSLEYATLAAGSGDVVGPSSSVTNGIVQFASTTGKALKDLGVGSANQVLLTDGTAPSFGSVTNAYIDAAAAIDFSKLASLTSGNILVGSAGNVATSVAMTGDVTISNTGVTAISAGVIVNADINATAAIAFSKMEALTASRALETDVSGFIVASAVTSTELGYVSGVTSGIQGQIDGKTGIADNENITGTWIFSNTITGDISGNAGTVTNGAYVNVTNSFTSTQNILATTNQLVLGTTNTTTISATAPSASRVYTMPDVGGNADFVMTAGTQTIGGAKTFSSSVSLQNGNADSTSTSIGADAGAFSLTDATNKLAALVAPHYSSATEEPVGIFLLSNTSTANSLRIGSSSSNFNSPTEIRLYTAANNTTVVGTERVRIDSAGNVGIGTASPLASLHTAGNVFINNGAADNYLYFSRQPGVFNRRAWVAAIAGTTGNAQALSFGTNLNGADGTEKMSISETGAVTLGPSGGAAHVVNGQMDITTSSGTLPGLKVTGASNATSSTFAVYQQSATLANDLVALYSNVGGTEVLKWRVENDGDTISATGSYTSDLRAKKDVAPIHYGLSEILQLDPMSYRWKHDDENEIKSFSLGSAQKVQEIMPEMVRDDGLDDGKGGAYKAVYEKEVVAVMVKAIQELNAKVEALKGA